MGLFGPEPGKQLRSPTRVLAVGSELGIATLIGLFGGSWLDGRFGTGPWLTILGLALGTTAGIRSLMRLAPKSPTQKTKAASAAPAEKTEPPR